MTGQKKKKLLNFLGIPKGVKHNGIKYVPRQCELYTGILLF